MSDSTYTKRAAVNKELLWLKSHIKTPPFSESARRQAGFLLRELQAGQKLSMPDSRPMPGIGPRVHELRIDDLENRASWRIVYRVDADAIVIGEIFGKNSRGTPHRVIEVCKKRFRSFDLVLSSGKNEKQ